MRTLLSVSFVLGALFASTLLPGTCARAEDAPPAGKVYELRVYHASPCKLEIGVALFGSFHAAETMGTIRFYFARSPVEIWAS